MPACHIHVFATPPPPVEHSDTMLLALRGLQFLSSAIVSVIAIATIYQWDARADRPATAIEMPTLAGYSAFAGIFGMMVSLEGSITLVWDAMHWASWINLDAICTATFLAGGSALAYLWRVNEAHPSNDWCHQLDDSERVEYDRCDHFEAQIMASAFFQLLSFSVSLLLTFLTVWHRRTQAVRLIAEQPGEEQWLLQERGQGMKHWKKLYS